MLSELDDTLAFTIDLDDTIGQREITVSGVEISGTKVMLWTDTEMLEGTFDAKGNAVIAVPGCMS